MAPLFPLVAAENCINRGGGSSTGLSKVLFFCIYEKIHKENYPAYKKQLVSKSHKTVNVVSSRDKAPEVRKAAPNHAYRPTHASARGLAHPLGIP